MKKTTLRSTHRTKGLPVKADSKKSRGDMRMPTNKKGSKIVLGTGNLGATSMSLR